MPNRSLRIAGSFLIAAGVVLFMGSRTARATTITQSATFGPATTDWSHGFNFNQFNPALGTLNDVIVTSQETLNTQGTVTNSASVPETFSFQETFLASLTLANHTTVQTSSVSLPTSYYSLASGGSSPYGPYNGQAGNTASTTYTLAGDLSLYIGTGSVSFAGQTLTGESIGGGGGNITASLITSAQEAVTVQYDYTPTPGVPEPFSLALSGTGLLLAAIVGRKRTMKSGS